MSVPLRYFEIADSTHRLINPLSRAMLASVADTCRLGPETRVLDLACGRGEMLCRWSSEFGSHGLGIDVHQGLLAQARERAAELGVADRVEFRREDAAAFRPAAPDYDIVSCLGASFIGGGLAGTLALMEPGLVDGGLLLVGEPYWKVPPTPQAIEARGCGPDEFADLAGTAHRIEAAGFDLVDMVLADEATWDRYSTARWRNLAAWLRANPDDPDHGGVLRYLESIRHGYLAHLRPQLGWGVFVAMRTGAAGRAPGKPNAG